MTTISQSIVINVLPEKVFDVITDPYLVLPLLPGLRSISHVKLPLTVGSTHRWQYQLLGITFRGSWTVDVLRPPLYYAASTKGEVDSRWVYTLVPKETATYLTLEITFGPPDSVLKRYALGFIEPHTGKLAEAYLHSLKGFVEESPKKDLA